MNYRLINLLSLTLILITFSGCDLIEDVLQFGFWLILFLIALVIVLLVLIFNALAYKPQKGENLTRSTSGSVD
jgi:hypothetical protein